jgi:hypothetical protein
VKNGLRNWRKKIDITLLKTDSIIISSYINPTEMKKIVVLHGVYILIIIMSLSFAFIQKTIATQQRELANKNAIEAQKNAEEAMRQKNIAEANAEEALRQNGMAELYKAKLEECENQN